MRPGDSTALAVFVLSMVTLLAVSGCAVSSDHPVSALDESEQIPEYLIGEWDFVELAGLDATGRPGGVIIGRNADGSLRVVLTEEAGSVEWSASLATVGGMTVISSAQEGGEEQQWVIGTIVMDGATQELTWTLLGHAEVIEDIRLGAVEGEVFEFDDQEFASLSATSAGLRAYLTEHGDVFTDRMAILRKQVP